MSRQIFYITSLSILGLVACFSSLSTLPFFIAMCVMIFLTSIRVELRIESISWYALTTRNPLIRAVRWPAILLLSSATLYFVFAYFSLYGDSYWNEARTNVLINMKHTVWIVDALGIWFYFTIVFYFIAAEWPTIMLAGVLAIYFFREYKNNSKNIFSKDERYLVRFHSLFLLICLFGLSISSATKLLRSFYPMYFSLLVLLGIFLMHFFRTAKSRRIFFSISLVAALIVIGFWNSVVNVSCTLSYRRDLPRYVQQSFRENALPRFPEATLFALPEAPWSLNHSNFFREMVGSDHSEVVKDDAELVSRVRPNDFLVTVNPIKTNEDSRWKVWSSLPAETCESLVDVYASENITAHYMLRHLPVQYSSDVLAAQSRPRLFLYRWTP